MRSHVLCILVSLAACGDNLGVPTDASGGGGTIDTQPSAVRPTVMSNTPEANATDIGINAPAAVTFSLPMDKAAMSRAFTLKADVGNVPVAGRVITSGATATFWPAAVLADNTKYVATVSTDAKSVEQGVLGAQHSWTFTTGATAVPGQGVNLGSAGEFVLLAKSGIVNVPTSMIRGNIGVSPITSTAIVGMPLTPDPSTQFSTTPQVTGRVYAADYAVPTPDYLTTAISDMETAFTDAAGRAPGVTELGAGTIGAITLVPGVYKWSSGLNITGNIMLSGNATDVWIFQIAQGVTMGSGVRIMMTGGGVPGNVYWQISGQLIVNTGAHLEGSVLTQTAATLDTGASLNGRLLAQTAVTVRGAMIVRPGL